MANATATPAPVATEPTAAAEAKAKANNFRRQVIRLRWHRDVDAAGALDLVSTVVKWAESKGHICVVADGIGGTSIRVGGTPRPGAQLMTRETRELVKASGITADELASLVAAEAARRAAPAAA
jgi:hypothetical protein